MKKLKRLQYLSIALVATIVFAITQIDKPQTRQVKMIEKVLPKTVMVYAGYTVKRLFIRFDEEKNTIYFEEKEVDVLVRGAGVFVTKSGHVLTCAHLLDVSTRSLGVDIEMFNGEIHKAEVLNVDHHRDLALLKITTPKATPYVTLAPTAGLRVGQEVISIGNPLGFAFTVTHGIISGLNVDLSAGYNMTQTDAFMNPGNSGGPLFDFSGRLVGINSRIVPPVAAPIFTGLGFAVSTDQISEYLIKFKDLGR